jgi:hypothetical protein
MALSKIDVANMLTGLVPNDNTIRRKNAKPLIINGSLEISQRGTSFTSNGYNLDRFTFDESTDGAVTVTQDSTVPTGQGFAKSVKFDVTTADGTLASNQYCQWTQFIEGQNLQLLKYGTSSAENLTLAFWVRSNKTGTYGVRFVKEAGGQTRYECPIIYTIDSADTWEKKVINLSPTAGSTSLITGAAGAIVNSNASGYRIAWILASGSDYHATNNTWVAASDKFTTSAQANLLDNTSNELYITGIQLEVGEYTSTTLPPFQHESFGDNLARCQRYYYRINPDADAQASIGEASYYSSSAAFVCLEFPIAMRDSPSLEQTTGTDYFNLNRNSANDSFDSFNNLNASDHTSAHLYISSGISGTAGHGGRCRFNDASARLAFSAEL